MTTIAVKNGYIAADSRATRGDFIDDDKVNKLHFIDGSWYAFSGSYHDGLILVNYYSGFITELPSELSCEGLVLPKKGKPKLITLSSGALLETDVPATYSIGSGGSLARAAMEAGASAERAVKIAAKFDTLTNSRVVVKKRGEP